MAVSSMVSFESQAAAAEGITLFGSAAFDTTDHRTGAASLRCNVGAGNNGHCQVAAANYQHFGVNVTVMPASFDRLIFGAIAAGTINVRLTPAGALKVFLNTTLIGTSSAAFAAAGWHWVGIRQVTGTSVVFLQIDGVNEVTGTATVTATSGLVGFATADADGVDGFFDDVIGDTAGFLAPSNVDIALPISDNSVGTGWTNDAAGTSNLWNAVDNEPPVGIADTTGSTGLHQIRNAAANLNAYAANLETYMTLGIGPSATVLAVQPIAVTGAPSATSPKAGSLTVSNPTIAKTTIGNFYNGSAIAGTFPTGWIQRSLAVTTSPAVTVGSSPVLTVTQDTSSTRVAMVCFMGLVVAWTPGARGRINTTLQAVARAANY